MVVKSRRNFLLARSKSSPAIRLPWVKDEATFIDGCTQCGSCLSACDENIIVKGEGGYPKIDFNKGECTYCTDCVSACKEPLFNDVKNDKPWDLNIEIKENCLALNNVFCQSCQDSCEVEAISFTYIHASSPQPKIDIDACNRCGACVSTCPQSAINISENSHSNNRGSIHERT